MLTMSQQSTIWELWQNGKNKSEISDVLHIDRKTVTKYLEKKDFSETLESYEHKEKDSKLDPYKEIIDRKMEEQSRYFHKQRFTASRMHEYLWKDLGHAELKSSYQLVQRYMRHRRNELKRLGYDDGGTLPLVWHPGEAQADFGEADFVHGSGEVIRHKYLVMAFPNSNRIVSLIMPGENCECVCQGLQDMFEFVGMVPTRIVFDNATGIGKRVCGELQESESFTRFRMHYGFSATYCNPSAGYEKGCVENAVGTFRRNFMVPPKTITCDIRMFNSTVMLPESFAFRSEKQHYRKKKPVEALFEEDLSAMHNLPETRFRVARISRFQLSNVGRFVTDNSNGYNLGPSHSGETIIVEKTAWDVICYDLRGNHIKTFERAYGAEVAESYDLESILNGTWGKPNSWMNSIIRDRMEDGCFKDYLDSSGFKDRRNALFMFAQISDEFGFGNASFALNKLASGGRIPTKDDARAFCNRIISFPYGMSENPTNVSLSGFDVLLGKEVSDAVC